METETPSQPDDTKATDTKVATKKEETPEVEETVHRDASWGAIITIIVILVMIIVGAFYAWGQRVAEQHGLPPTSTSQTPY